MAWTMAKTQSRKYLSMQPADMPDADVFRTQTPRTSALTNKDKKTRGFFFFNSFHACSEFRFNRSWILPFFFFSGGAGGRPEVGPAPTCADCARRTPCQCHVERAPLAALRVGTRESRACCSEARRWTQDRRGGFRGADTRSGGGGGGGGVRLCVLCCGDYIGFVFGFGV